MVQTLVKCIMWFIFLLTKKKMLLKGLWYIIILIVDEWNYKIFNIFYKPLLHKLKQLIKRKLTQVGHTL